MIQIIFKKPALTTYYLTIMTDERLKIGFKKWHFPSDAGP